MESLDLAAMEKIFSEVNCLLGIWSYEIEESIVNGIIICKSSNIYFGFLPKDTQENGFHAAGSKAFHKILSLKTTFDEAQTFVKSVICSTICSHDACESSQILEKYNAKATEYENISFSSLKAFCVLDNANLRKHLEETFAESNQKARFSAVHKPPTNPTKPSLQLLTCDNGLQRFPGKHLIGCPHNLLWSGDLRFFRLFGKDYVDECRFSGWAVSCRCGSEEVSEPGREAETVPEELWKLMPCQLFILSLKPGNPTLPWLDSHNLPSFVMEVGSVSSEIITDLRVKTTLSFVFRSGIPTYVMRYYFRENEQKIVCRVISDFRTVFMVYQEVKRLTMETSLLHGENIFGPNTESDEFTKRINLMLGTNEGTMKINDMTKGEIYKEGRGMEDRSVGTALWLGEMQVCLVQEERVEGLEKPEEYRKVLSISRHDCVLRAAKDDIGSVRNCPVRSQTGHYVYSNYAFITGTIPNNKDFPAELFSSRAKEKNVALIALNVERRTVQGR